MPFIIPNIETAGLSFNGMAVQDQTDITIHAQAADGTGVVSGCQVTQNSGSNMNVSVAAGVVTVLGLSYTVSATTGTGLAIAAASTNADRRDLVVYTVGTGLQVLTGPISTVGNYPIKPPLGTGSNQFNVATMVALGEVYVASTTTAITSGYTSGGNIVDKTLIVGAVPVTATLASSQTCTTSQAPLLSLTLGVGTWKVDFHGRAAFTAGTAQTMVVLLNTASGTATCTVAGAYSCEANQTSTGLQDSGMIGFSCVVSVTVAGTVVLNLIGSAASGTVDATDGLTTSPVTGAVATLIP
jgi:hypothetical protein